MSLDNNSHSVFLFDSGYEIWQKDVDCSIHRANHRGSRKDSFREEKCIIVRQFNTDAA